ncbi:hypothetical protein [Mycolicibacterium fluoranthenivorans]|uniref:Uncharacterized protein n=1 Tax=Mycolicibacterium fluoranthenivorans TaxID=258505 RepID=A0A7X5U477_9MYCO|nr:hypothetical protein [Mycolicibacterium fluoranthenivorans]MCV7358483.1 hypothetical protein [Mycolicibacterium fluoranthenivorans]NIH98059.1 hypothetical protein [Mycolicibacterium fluoranthenivorans]
MSELVTITPQAEPNTDGDPQPAGAPFDVMAMEIAPGNTVRRFGVGGDLDSVEFTVFLPLRRRIPDTQDYQATVEALTDNFRILVRDRDCAGRAQVWDAGGRGGVVVLCHSARGKA